MVRKPYTQCLAMYEKVIKKPVVSWWVPRF